jgi:hypothetical protein
VGQHYDKVTVLIDLLCFYQMIFNLKTWKQLLDFFPNGQNIIRVLEDLLGADFASLQASYTQHTKCAPR